MPHWGNANELGNYTPKYVPDLDQRHSLPQPLPSYCLSVLLCFSVGKSHRRDAADRLQQAPQVAVTASHEENVKDRWLSQVFVKLREL